MSLVTSSIKSVDGLEHGMQHENIITETAWSGYVDLMPNIMKVHEYGKIY